MGTSHQNAEGAGVWASGLGGPERWHRQKEILTDAKGAPLRLFGTKAASSKENPAKVQNLGSKEGGGGSTCPGGRRLVLTLPLTRPAAQFPRLGVGCHAQPLRMEVPTAGQPWAKHVQVSP